MSQSLHHQDRCAAFCGPSRAWHRAGQTGNLLLSGGGRHRSRVTFALTGGCIAVQPVSCQSTTQITALQHAPQATTNPAVFVRAAASSHPSLCSRTPPCAEAMTHTSQTPKAYHALNQIFCYGLYMQIFPLVLVANEGDLHRLHTHMRCCLIGS